MLLRHVFIQAGPILNVSESSCKFFNPPDNDKRNYDLKLDTITVCSFVVIVMCLFLFCLNNNVSESNWCVGGTTEH